MSARVVNPMVMSEMRRMLRAYGENGPRHNVSSTPESADLARVRRDLFGPVDHSDNQRFVDRELVSQQTRDADRWGFDFARESPRKAGPGTARYSWEKVTPSEPVPEPYALRRLPYLQQSTTTVSASTTTAAAATTTAAAAAPAAAVVEDELVPSVAEKTKEDGSSKTPVETAANQPSKQSQITDYMKGRKRNFNSSSGAKSRAQAPPPSKQARTTTPS